MSECMPSTVIAEDPMLVTVIRCDELVLLIGMSVYWSVSPSFGLTLIEYAGAAPMPLSPVTKVWTLPLPEPLPTVDVFERQVTVTGQLFIPGPVGVNVPVNE